MSKWIRKDDRVTVTAGNDKGRVGVVLQRLEDRVVVQGVNVRKKHIKKTQKMPTAQIIDREMPIHISNVSFCNAEDKPVRVSVRVGEQGNKELVYSENGKNVVLRSINKK